MNRILKWFLIVLSSLLALVAVIWGACHEIELILIGGEGFQNCIGYFYILLEFFGKAKVMHCCPLQLKIDNVYDHYFRLVMVFYQDGIPTLGFLNRANVCLKPYAGAIGI